MKEIVIPLDGLEISYLQIPNHFDDNIILRQLRYTGMLETVRIRRAGYSVRIEYEVGEHYRSIENINTFLSVSISEYFSFVNH